MVLLTHKKAKEQEEAERLREHDGSTQGMSLHHVSFSHICDEYTAPLPMEVGPPATHAKGKSEVPAALSIPTEGMFKQYV